MRESRRRPGELASPPVPTTSGGERGPKRALNFRIELEESVQRLFELLANFAFAAFDEVHGYVRCLAVLEADFGLADFLHFVGWKQPHAIEQCQSRHLYLFSKIQVI